MRAVPLSGLPFFQSCRWRYTLLDEKLIFHPIVALSPIFFKILLLILISFCCRLYICDSSFTLKVEELLLVSTTAVYSVVVVNNTMSWNVRHRDADWGLHLTVALCHGRDVPHLSGLERFFWLADRDIGRHHERVRWFLHASLFIFLELDHGSTLFLVAAWTCSLIFVVSELLLLFAVWCLHHF